LVKKEIIDTLARLHSSKKTTIPLVEHDVKGALAITNRGSLRQKGRIVLEGDATELSENPSVKEIYLGRG
jgi:ABC-type branched-subunit amino acid transport system ATPase component